jgi:hypothetical protein
MMLLFESAVGTQGGPAATRRALLVSAHRRNVGVGSKMLPAEAEQVSGNCQCVGGLRLARRQLAASLVAGL